MIQAEESVPQLENEKSTPVIDPEQPCSIELEKTTSSEGDQLEPTDLEQPDSSTSTELEEPVEMQPPTTDPISVKLAKQEPTKSPVSPKQQGHTEEAEAQHTGVTEGSDFEPTSRKADGTPSACKPPESPVTRPAKHPTGKMPISSIDPASPQPSGPDSSASELILLSAYDTNDYIGESQISNPSETNWQRLEGDGLPVSVPGNVNEEEKTSWNLSADVPTKDCVVNNTVQEDDEAPSAVAKKVMSIGLMEIQREAPGLGSNTEPEVKASKFAEAQFQNEPSPGIRACDLIEGQCPVVPCANNMDFFARDWCFTYSNIYMEN
ncbi:uncharacterized protein LOC106152158 [Lingula anatina]|uniref:Uncharacterized protein LOC106152158 n=1 Tax=Lingula anatina TaxID=7574 RepID=A0A2R2MLE3_LINAN|nr:uncharacterized protein LOC106152158 [Lingula anatina]|eukprot:XP_023931033.1 uncharacterized protein LOC106152158 [Lingula anatina]